jgi:hypothetical protein
MLKHKWSEGMNEAYPYPQASSYSTNKHIAMVCWFFMEPPLQGSKLIFDFWEDLVNSPYTQPLPLLITIPNPKKWMKKQHNAVLGGRNLLHAAVTSCEFEEIVLKFWSILLYYCSFWWNHSGLFFFRLLHIVQYFMFVDGGEEITCTLFWTW